MNFYLTLALSLFVYMCAWFFVSIWQKRNDVADLAWGLGFVYLAWLAFYLSGFKISSAVVNLLVTIWGFRLAFHIYFRLKKKPEDYRYLNWRKEWKKAFYWRSFLQVYILQGIFLYLISLPVLLINQSGLNRFDNIQILGILVWITGFLFESLGDWQLKQFVSDPGNKGKIMTSGLWRYSRHPNYFGEVTMWWGIFLIASPLPSAIFTIIGPITITILILFVSGIPLLEKKYESRADFEEYKRKTSLFFPLPPKK